MFQTANWLGICVNALGPRSFGLAPFHSILGKGHLDPQRAQRNTLNNAAKYTETGGKIAVVVEHLEDAVITVRDTGIGIAPELLPQPLEVFFQADASLDRPAEDSE